MNTDKLFFGAAYYSEYLPYDRVEQDMELMERAGMNTIRIAESTWSTLEPADGVYDFTHLDRMLSAAQRHHISVIVGTPTYAIPAWLAKKYPDILAITTHGRELYGHRQNMDITHPGYRKHAERIIRVLMEHVKDVPNIIGFQLDNETKSYGTSGIQVQARFVEYLKQKFNDINEFNREFGLDYWSNRIDRWEDFPDIRGTVNQSLAAEYQAFLRSLVTEFLSWQASIVSEYKRPEQFITQNFDFAWTTHSFGYQPEVDQYEAAKCMTVAGTDIYHPSQEDLTGAEITLCGNIARSLKHSNYLVLETQAQGNPEWLPYPGQLRLQAYSHIANGSNSVLYWHWHSIHNSVESYWKGVLSHDFSENETYREACRIGSEWKRIGRHLINLKKENRTAVLVDNRSLTGLCQFPFAAAGEHSYNTVLRWLCDALYRLNIEYDIIPSSRRNFSEYKCLIVPALYSAPEDLLYALSGYTAAGGCLIATFRTGFSDEYLKIYSDTQPHILHECLGLHYDQFTRPKNTSVFISDPADDAQTNFLPNESEKKEAAVSSAAYEWMELVTCDTAVPAARYCHPVWSRYAAAAQNHYQNGTTLYIATMFDDRMLDNLLTRFLSENGILSKSPGEPRFPVIKKTGINMDGKTICYYFNYSRTKQPVIHKDKPGTELLTGKNISAGEVLILPPWELSIIEI